MIVNGVTLLARHLDILADVVKRGRASVCFETHALLVSAGVLANLYPYPGVDSLTIERDSLTDAGRRAADLRLAARGKASRRARASRSARADVMRSLGLTRTRSGAWE